MRLLPYTLYVSLVLQNSLATRDIDIGAARLPIDWCMDSDASRDKNGTDGTQSKTRPSQQSVQ